MVDDDHTFESSQVMDGRVVHFSEMVERGSALTFIDSALPGHRRLNIALVGDTAAEDPRLRALIPGPHTFQLGMFLCLPGEGPAWHLHEYVEAFIPLSGRWRFHYATSEDHLDKPDGEEELAPWDVISLPAGVWRSFENTSNEPAWCLGVLDSHAQFTSKDPQWPIHVVDQAAHLGLTSDAQGKLVTTPKSAGLAEELRRTLLDAAVRTGPPPSGCSRSDGREPAS